MQLVVNRKALAKFRRMALRQHPLEYVSTIWGYAKGEGFVLDEFREIDHDATCDSVRFRAEDSAFGTRDGKLILLGTIHSHPDWALCEPSEGDWADAARRNELIMGIMAIPQVAKNGIRKRSRVKFFFAQAMCEAKYS